MRNWNINNQNSELINNYIQKERLAFREKEGVIRSEKIENQSTSKEPTICFLTYSVFSAYLFFEELLIGMSFRVLAEHFSLFCGTAVYSLCWSGMSLYLPCYAQKRKHLEVRALARTCRIFLSSPQVLP